MCNKTELALVVMTIVLAFLFSGIILPFIVSTDKLPLSLIIILFCLIVFLMIIGIQAIINYFYVRFQRHVRRKMSKLKKGK
jgi:hypothetical protein